MEPDLAAGRERFVVLAQPTALAHPRERTLHHPPPRNHLEALLPLLLADEFEDPAAELLGPRLQLSRVGAVGPDLLQSLSAVVEPGKDEPCALAILHVGPVHYGAEQQAVGVYKDVPLATGDLLAPVVAVGIPLLPAVFTLCVSNTAALGLRGRPFLARASSRSTS